MTEYDRWKLAEPPEPENLVECVQCHCNVERDACVLIDGDFVCEDCLADYCIAHAERYAEDYIAIQDDYAQYVAQHYATLDERKALVLYALDKLKTDDNPPTVLLNFMDGLPDCRYDYLLGRSNDYAEFVRCEHGNY